MRPLLTTARAGLRASLRPAAPMRTQLPQLAPPLRLRPQTRSLMTTPPPRARYERFEGPSYGQPGRPGANLYRFLWRRLGGDRGVILFGIGLGGAAVYYIAQ